MLLVAFMTTTAFAACGGDDNDGGGSQIKGLTVTKTTLTFTKAGGTETVSAQSSQQVTATSDASWLTVTTGQMSANLKVTPITVTATAMNGETQDRTATITVTAGSETALISVTQKAGDVLTVSQTAYEVAAAGGTVTVSLVSNGNYTATSNAAWLTVSGTSSSSLTLTAAANVAGERTGTVTLQLNSEQATITVTQAAGQQGAITAKAMDIAKLMYPGWNLGNTMEGGDNKTAYQNAGIGTECSWQSTKTSQQIIDFVKSQGFRSVRIPTAWVMGHITNEAEMTIDAAWMGRVKEIVDYCVGIGLYVEVNDHWDAGWLENSFSDISDATVAKNSEKLKKLWTQIATTFRDYDEHVLFGGLNEPGAESQSQTNALLKYEQAFIDAVRATGGNNALRTLVVQGPATDIEKTNNWFDVTKLSDPAGAGRLMVEVHYYTPPQFTGVWENNQPIWFWGAANHVSGDSHNATWGEESTVKSMFQLMKTKFADKGYPLLLGEYGANWRKLSSNQEQHDASIKLYHQVVCQQAVSCGMVPIVWDINVANQQGTNGIMTVINRANCTVFCQPALDGIKAGIAAASWPY